jgi:hypothetical protein
MSKLEVVQKRLQMDFLPHEEWDYVKSMADESEGERLAILTWVFTKSLAFWDTRARAGLLLLSEKESETWQLIEDLVDSIDPDDNGTALTLFEMTHDARGYELARKWLENVNTHPATQLEAIAFLHDRYPEKAKLRLQSLLNDPIFGKGAARLMDELEQGNE